MRKDTGEVQQIRVTKVVCDQCGRDVGVDYIHYDAHWSDGYDRFGEDMDFCSTNCMLNFLQKNYTADSNLYFPPANEDIRIEIPTGMFRNLLDKLLED